MKTLLRIMLLFISLSLLAACAAPDYDIRGAWEYTLIDQNENTYDAGTITFSGSPGKGTWQLVNIYEVEYDGAYSVSGTTLKLSGDEQWGGTVTDLNHIDGTWKSDEASGSWTAVRNP